MEGCVKQEKICLNKGWKFFDGDFPKPDLNEQIRYRADMYAIVEEGPRSPNYDDSDWKTVDLPHDFVMAHPRNPEITQYYGFKDRGVGWYRYCFAMPESEEGANFELQFEGIATIAEVYFNGALVANHRYGNVAISADVTPMMSYGEYLNTIVVRADATLCEGWWFEGGGITRNVWLVKRSPVHFQTDGLYVNPVFANDHWEIPAELTIENSSTLPATVSAAVSISDKDGNIIAAEKGAPCEVKPFKTAVSSIKMTAQDTVKRWDIDSPVLYNVKVTLYDEGGNIIDQVKQRCGFRSFSFDANKGFFLNGRSLRLNGVCCHQDCMGVGNAVPRSMELWKLKKLKEMGCNALRTAHHPPTSSLLDACDELGIMVMDENRRFGICQDFFDNLAWMVRRDRNHPSIILWSIFNEEPFASVKLAEDISQHMVAVVKELDTTRPTCCAMNGGWLSAHNASTAVDVCGVNYTMDVYDRLHEFKPNQPIIATETACTVVNRGEPFTVPEKHIYADNDIETVSWGNTQREVLESLGSRPWLAGDFVWAGIDYHGEPTPMKWPSNSTFFGLMDMCGFPKSGYFVRKAVWLPDRPLLHIAPRWNLDIPEGTLVDVLVICNQAEVELFLNGDSMGRVPVDRYLMNTFKVPYHPGKLSAVAYGQDGRKVCEAVNFTTGKPTALVLQPTRTTIADDGYDTIPVEVFSVDENGLVVQCANNLVNFSIEGDGISVGVGNGDQNSLEDELGTSRSLYNGFALILIRAKNNGRGSIILHATSDGLDEATCEIKIEPNSADRTYMVPATRFVTCTGWRKSPFYKEKPDPTVVFADDDVNTWEPATVGEKYPDRFGRFVMFRTDVSKYAGKKKAVVFRSITGSAEIYLDGKRIRTKNSTKAEDFFFFLPDGVPGKKLTVLLEANEDGFLGITGPVVIQQ